jgi:gliding motility-associated-like protein
MLNNTNLKNKISFLKKIQKQIFIIALLFITVVQANAQVPLNDEPCNGTAISAITLVPTAVCNFTTFSNVDASNSTGTGIPNPTCANFTDADVWFKATVPVGATQLVIDTKNFGLTDGGLSVYTATGTCPSLTMTELSCADAGSTNPSMPKLTITQPAGTTVYIRFWGWGGEVGTFGICVSANIPPANDECLTAQSLTVNNNLTCAIATAGTTNNATQSSTLPVPTCAVTNAWNDDVWYSFVATGIVHRVSLLNVAGTSTAMNITVYSGTCAAFTQVGCINGNTLDLGGLTAGTTYFVRVFTNVIATTSSASFNICIGTPPPPPPNDECVNATVLTVNPNFLCAITTAGTTVSATQSNTLPTPTCSATNGWNDDVWYSFVATNTAHRVVVASTSDIATSVYSGTCTSLVQLGCVDFPEPNTFNLTGLTVNNTYYVRVMTWTGTIGTTANFTVCVGTPPPPPLNNECLNAFNAIANPNYLCAAVTAGTTTSATSSVGAPTPTCSPTGVDDDVWFKFTATNTNHRISLLNITGTTTALTSVIYSGTCTGLTEVSCNTTNLYNVTTLTAGQIYYIRVFTTSATPALEANFNLCIGTPPPPPPNDECVGAISLPVNAFNPIPNSNQCALVTTGSTAGATQSANLPTPTCSPANGWDDDIWYSFVATSTDNRVSLSSVVGTTTNMLTTVYSGTCAALVQLRCVTVDPNVISLSNLTVGATYYVRVQTELANGGDATFNICVSTPGPGETCGTGNQGVCSQSVSSTTQNPTGLGTISCLTSTPNPTFYYFQVQTSGTITYTINQLNLAGVGIDIDFALWGPFANQTAGCNSIAATPGSTIACSFSAAATETFTIPNAIAGQWYVLLVTNYNGGEGNFTIIPSATNTGSTAPGIACGVTASNNGPVCPGGVFNITATGPAGYAFSWTGPSGFTSNVQNPPAITASTTPGSYTYTVTASFGATSLTAVTTVVVTAPPPIPTVVTPLAYCQFSNAPALTATVTTAGNTLLFYTVPTGGTGVTTLTPSTAAIGTITYYVSQKTGSCEGPRTPIVVNVAANTTPVPTVNPTALTYCQGVTAVSLASNVTGGTGLLWYTTATGGTGTAIAPIPSTTLAGVTTYWVSQTVGACESPRVAIAVTVTPYSPTPTTLTNPINYCQNATVSILTATGINLLWYTTATGGTGVATAPTPSAATVGTIIYYVTQTTNGCESLRLPISVIVTANPAAPTVTSPVNYCQNQSVGALTVLTGTNVTWYTVSTGGAALPGAPTPITTAVGSTTYWVQSNNGACISARVPILINIALTPPAPTTIPVVYCQGDLPVALSAPGAGLLWYNTATGGAGVAAAPTPSTATVGTTTYWVSSTIGACEGPRSPIVVTVNTTPVAPTVVTPVNYCQNTIAASIVASVTTGTGLLWYTTATGGTGSTIAPTLSTLVAGTTSYFVSSKIGNCEGPRSEIKVVVTGTPVLPTPTPTLVTYCTNVTATPLTATGNNLLWYTTITGGIGSTTAPTPQTVTAGTTLHYVTQSTAIPIACESPRALVTVVVNPRPAVPGVITPIPYCQNFAAPALTATVIGTNNLLWYTAAAGGTGSASSFTPFTSSVGSTSYFVSQSALGCEGLRTEIVVNIRPEFTVNAGTDVTIARGDQTQLLGIVTGPANPVYLWTADIAPLSLTDSSKINPIANPIFTTNYTLKVTDPTGLCPSKTDIVRVEVVQSCINVRNAFTPNGDGINDTWMVYDRDFCLRAGGGANVTIFNRYGSKVYVSTNYTNGFDGTFKGKPLPDGTYYAVIEFTLFDGRKQYKRTDVTIIR